MLEFGKLDIIYKLIIIDVRWAKYITTTLILLHVTYNFSAKLKEKERLARKIIKIIFSQTALRAIEFNW